jgi:hypothetical protein
MKDLDARIRETLQEDEDRFLARLEQPSLTELVGETFRSRARWLTVISVVATVGFVGVAAWSLVELLRAETPRALVLWQTLLLFSLIAVGANKLWFWLELQRVTLTRELKRLELQLAHLAGRGGEGSDRDC